MKCPKCGYNSFEFLDNCKKCNSDLTGFKQSHGISAIVIPFQSGADKAAAATIAMTSPSLEASPATTEETFTWETPAPSQPPIPKAGEDIFSDLDLGFSAPSEAESAEETFSFDLEPTAETTPPPAPATGESGFAGFALDEPPVETAAAPVFAAESGEDETFAGLLETDRHDDAEAAVSDMTGVELESPWDVPTDSFGGFAEEPASANPPAETEPPGSFDLESFGWEEQDSRKEPAQPAPKGPKVELEGFSSDEFESLFNEPEKEKK